MLTSWPMEDGRSGPGSWKSLTKVHCCTSTIGIKEWDWHGLIQHLLYDDMSFNTVFYNFILLLGRWADNQLLHVEDIRSVTLGALKGLKQEEEELSKHTGFIRFGVETVENCLRMSRGPFFRWIFFKTFFFFWGGGVPPDTTPMWWWSDERVFPRGLGLPGLEYWCGATEKLYCAGRGDWWNVIDLVPYIYTIYTWLCMQGSEQSWNIGFSESSPSPLKCGTLGTKAFLPTTFLC